MTGMSIYPHDSNRTIKGLTLEGTPYVGSIVSAGAGHHGTLANILFKRCMLRNDIAAGDRARWAWGPLYNQVDNVWEDCVVEDAGYDEHAYYPHSSRGNMTWRRCISRRAGGQNIQSVWRLAETDDPDGYKVTGTHLVEGGETDHCGLPRGSGRASFALSFFGKQMGPYGNWGPRSEWDCSVIIKDHKITHDTLGQPAGWQLNGAILVEWRPRFELLGGSVSYDGPADQSLILAHMNQEVIVDGLQIHGARFFDINGVAAGRTKLIDIKNVTDNVILRIDGKKIGPLNQGYYHIG